MAVVWTRNTQIDQWNIRENKVTDYVVCNNVTNGDDNILIQW